VKVTARFVDRHHVDPRRPSSAQHLLSIGSRNGAAHAHRHCPSLLLHRRLRTAGGSRSYLELGATFAAPDELRHDRVRGELDDGITNGHGTDISGLRDDHRWTQFLYDAEEREI